MANTLLINGEQALAKAAIDEHITLATGYPGSPAGGIISLLEVENSHIDVHWSANEKVAIEKGIGVAITGNKALVCVKSVGLNAMLDPLTVANLTPLTGALVIIVGDDPGGYVSQNDQDSRRLAQFLNLPWFEPDEPNSGYKMMRLAFKLSANYGLPVFVRITRSFALTQSEVNRDEHTFMLPEYNLNKSIVPRFVPQPSNAVAKHRELIKRINSLQKVILSLKINQVAASDSHTGLILCGHLISKTRQVCEIAALQQYARVLFMQSIYPINTPEITGFLSGLKKVIILEENTPVISSQIMAIAAKAKIQLEWLTVAEPGETFRWHIAKVLASEFPGLAIHPKYAQPIDEKPQLKSNCSDSRYGEVLDLLDESAKYLGKQINYYGDPGCLVSVSDRLQAKYAMGGSVATAFGANMVNTNHLRVALIGDSGFFHSALPAIIDAAYHKASLPMILLNNSAALTTGGQYHPGIVRQNNSQRLDYREILQSCGIDHFKRVNLDMPKGELVEMLSAFLKLDGIRFLEIDIE